MKIYLLLPIFAVAFSGHAKADSFPFNPSSLPDYVVDNQSRANARLKISVAAASDTTTPALRIGGIVLCSRTACYRPNTLNNTGITHTENGSATLISDSALPFTRIEKVFFETVKGGNMAGSISLSRALNIENGYYGGEIFITLKSAGQGDIKTYLPEFATSNLLRENGRSIYYNPAYTVHAKLDLGLTFTIPAGALSKPEIFNVQVRHTGEQFPSVDIYPYVNLKKNATLNAKLLEKPVTLSSRSKVLTAPPPGADDLPKKSLNSPPSVEKTISKTGPIRSSFFEQPQANLAQPKNMGVATVGISTPCSDLVAYAPNMQKIQDTVKKSPSGIVYIPWCTDIKPYVHIAFANLNHPQIKYQIPYKLVNKPGTNYRWHELRRLSDVIREGGVAINGFYWTGDEGTGPHQGGEPQGYLKANGIYLANNIPGGGLGSSSGDEGNKFLMLHYPNLSASPTFYERSSSNHEPFEAHNAVSSSTSILKYSTVCSGDTTSYRWSAVGAGPGFTVLVSSTSEGETSASELCSLFSAFGVHGALRLDGGPTAAMVLDNNLLNPLKGLYSFRYGDSRHIPYGLHFWW